MPVFEDARGPNVRVLRQVQRRLSPAELEALIAEYEAGARVCELAKVYDLHRTTVARHVARASKTRPVMTEAQSDEAVRLYGNGWTLRNIGMNIALKTDETMASDEGDFHDIDAAFADYLPQVTALAIELNRLLNDCASQASPTRPSKRNQTFKETS